MSDIRNSIGQSVALVAASVALSVLAPKTACGQETFLQTHCVSCHSEDAENSLPSFAELSVGDVKVAQDAELWEKIVRRLRARQMPPPDFDRPAEAEYVSFLNSLEQQLDERAKATPRPGHTDSIRRLTRTEYANAVRDLLGVRIQPEEFFPADQEGHGFDNVTLSQLPPVLLHRYITAAEKIARTAVGGVGRSPAGRTIRIPADRSQDAHVDGLPLGTRGGVAFDHTFAQTGEYEIQLRLMRDRDEKIEGLRGDCEIDVLIDRARKHRFEVKAPKGGDRWGPDFTLVDAHLKKRLHVEAGDHQVGVTFPQTASSLSEIRRQPFETSFNRHRHPRLAPAIFEVSIVGPFDSQGPGATASRRLIFGEALDETGDGNVGANGASANGDAATAEMILRRLLRLAYRRDVTDADLRTPMSFFHKRFAADGFDAGLESAIASILVNPHFLLRVEQDVDAKSGEPSRISDLELASRLSFFLWSSLPDSKLLTAASSGLLSDPDGLTRHVQRMLEDDKSQSLVTNFAAQWLYLRNVSSLQPDRRLFPDFDDNLRWAMKRETELLFESVVREDRSVLDLIRSNRTFLNERLARHYGVSGVVGSDFRPVRMSADSRRGGILRHASILSVTSYATRTSPTIRGNWILENILGTPAPPPPANVPALKEKSSLGATTVRERLAQHRENPACASCHDLMDPVGFALENFDALGRYRVFDDGHAVDSEGALPDGTKIDDVKSLEDGIMRRPEIFVGTLTEKLLTFALGRGLTADDAPYVRQIVRDAEASDYAFSEIVLGIARSVPFQMRDAK